MSKIRVLRAKLHGLRVTDANLEYQGSITLDPVLCAEAGVYPLEFVEIWNKNSGARITTYVIFGEPGSRWCVLNGAAARTCQPGDEVIIAASTYVEPGEIYDLQPRVLLFGPDNQVMRRVAYDVYAGTERHFDLRMLEDDGTPPRVDRARDRLSE